MTALTAASPVLPLRLRMPFSLGSAILIHLSVLVMVVFSSARNEVTMPVPLSGFEMVELPSPPVMPDKVAFPLPEMVEPEIVEKEMEIPTEVLTLPVIEPETEQVEGPDKIDEPVLDRPVIARVKPVVMTKPAPPKAQVIPNKNNKVSETKQPLTRNNETAAPAATYIPPNANVSYLRNPKPFYPRIARKRGMEGTVLLSVSVSMRGDVLALNIRKTSGHAVLDNAAMETVKKWKFQPAQRGDTLVNAVVDVPIRFRLNLE